MSKEFISTITLSKFIESMSLNAFYTTLINFKLKEEFSYDDKAQAH